MALGSERLAEGREGVEGEVHRIASEGGEEVVKEMNLEQVVEKNEEEEEREEEEVGERKKG